MALTEAEKDKLRLALGRVAAQLGDEPEAGRMRLLADALAEAGVNPSPADWDEFAREERARAMTDRMHDGRADEALAAIFAAVAVAGVNSPGELMARRGLATVPDLLASLGFSGDLDALAQELEAAVDEMRR